MKHLRLKISAFYFFYFAAVGVYVIFMPSILKLNSFSSFDIGIIFAAAPFSRFVAPFFFIKHFKLNQHIFKISLIITQISGILIVLFLDSFWILFFLMIVLGFFWSTILPFIENLSLQFIDKKDYGKVRLFGSLGFIAVALGNSYIGLQWSKALYIFSISLTVFFGFLLLNYIQNNNFDSKKQSFSISHIHFWIAIFLTQVSFGAFYNFFTIYETQAGISLDIVSYLWSFGVIAEVFMFGFQKFIIKFQLSNLISFSILITSIRWLLYFLFPTNLTILFIASSFHAFSFALLHTASIAYINENYKNKALAQQFYVGIAFGLGALVGSFISGIIYGDNLFLYACLIALLAFFVSLLSRHKLFNLSN
jgi:PPP family 3-phenylpropionic acid transporter